MSLKEKESSDNLLKSLADLRRNPFIASESQTVSNGKPTVVGLYGVSGCGKSYLLKQLEQALGRTQFTFYDGSTMIANIVPGGLTAFKSMEQRQQIHWRQRAIDTVGMECVETGKVGIVAGHFMFWEEEQEEGRPIYTQNDMETYTHIIYLDTPAETIAERRLNDTERSRPVTSAAHLQKWQSQEKMQLRSLCRQHGILFSSAPSDQTLQDWVSKLLLAFQYGTEEHNLSCAERRLDEIITSSQGQITTMVVLDADRTLTSEDTGFLYWKLISESKYLEDGDKTLKDMFNSSLGYSYIGFRQAMLLYEETANDQEFDTLCQEVASLVPMHPEFLSLLQLVQEQKHMGAIVMTSGLRRIWEKVLAREGFSESVSVVGGGRIADGFVVTAHVKGALTARLRKTYNMYVWAFGDSPLDIEMLCEADQAIVVVGEESKRSAGMDKALIKAIKVKDHGLRARQVLLPNNALPRLDSSMLPTVKLTDPEFVKTLLGDKYTPSGLQVLCASDKNHNAAKLLATPMRHAAIAGPNLRRAHGRVGHYLAIEYMSNVIGLEPSPVDHVLGHQTSGFQLFHEKQTTIAALMRGGEPMALGVNDAFPLAMFVHASNANDIKPHHLDGQLTMVLVDSVINTGKTVIEFVQHVRKLHATIRIVVVAGVVQAQCVNGGSLEQALADQVGLHLIALRTSETKFTGSGTTDTGNRLFNTTHLP